MLEERPSSPGDGRLQMRGRFYWESREKMHRYPRGHVEVTTREITRVKCNKGAKCNTVLVANVLRV